MTVLCRRVPRDLKHVLEVGVWAALRENTALLFEIRQSTRVDILHRPAHILPLIAPVINL